MRKMNIATVIVTYKTASLTVDAITSIHAERIATGWDIRVVVVDNDSGDYSAVSESVQVNGWFGWVTVLKAPKNGGFAYGNNLGIDRAYRDRAPDYVYLLNPDTQVRPGGVKALVEFLESHQEAGIAGSNMLNQDGSDWSIAFRFPTIVSEVFHGASLGILNRLSRRWEVAKHMGSTPECVDWICGASMLIRPAVLSAIGGFDENYFLYFEETDFCYRARRAGFQTWYVPDSRVMHIMGQSTQVTDLRAGPKRLPTYWFESRRRYFAVTLGVRNAIAVDVAACLAHSIGLMKHLILQRRRRIVPNFIGDLIHHSPLWPRNRSIPPVRAHLACVAATGKY